MKNKDKEEKNRKEFSQKLKKSEGIRSGTVKAPRFQPSLSFSLTMQNSNTSLVSLGFVDISTNG